MTNLLSLKGSKFDFYTIFANLIKNAIDEAERKGLEHKICFIDFDNDHNELSVTISDAGGGMPNEIYAQIGEHIISNKSNSNGIGIKSSLEYLSEVNGKYQLNPLNEIGGVTWVIKIPLMKDNLYTKSVMITDQMEKIIISADTDVVNFFSDKINCKVIASSEDIKTRLSFIKQEQYLIFLDVDTVTNCFDLIESKKITNQCYILSDKYDVVGITSKAIFFKMKIIPKKYVRNINFRKFEV